MSESLTTKFVQQFTATVVNTLPFDNVVSSPFLDISLNLSSGSATGAANQIFRDQRTLAQSGTEVINVYNFNGSADPVGLPLTMATVKTLIITNLNGTESNVLTVGGDTSGGAWRSPFNGNSAAKVTIPGGAALTLTSSGSTAWAVAITSSGSLLKFSNDGTGALTYDLIVAGGTPYGS